MARITFAISFFLFISCKESFNQINFEQINKRISKDSTINSPIEIMKMYYNPPQFEENSHVFIKTDTLNKVIFRVTLEETGAGDDSEAGTKVIMTVEKLGKFWQINELKLNWKCHEGRGHTSWGISICD